MKPLLFHSGKKENRTTAPAILSKILSVTEGICTFEKARGKIKIIHT